MNFRAYFLPAFSVLYLTGVVALAATENHKRLRLHPGNPHYFLFRGKPTVLITSGEHYGAVLNPDFDYVKYLDTLAKDGLNLTRTFAGAYCEPSGAFNIASNTLAPSPTRFICPWARSDRSGYANGGNKFDLTKWDEAYFKRLKDFVEKANKRGIVVELNLFCPMYEESQWRLSPQNAVNNVNSIGNITRTNVYTLNQNGGLLAVQDAMVRKIVGELIGFDNVYYEICNEPYFGGVTMEWQHHIADVIVATERGLPGQGSKKSNTGPAQEATQTSSRPQMLPSSGGVGDGFAPAEGLHLISQNIANNKAKVANPHPAISIFNFHYASPPETLAMNYNLNKVIGDNETGFRGTNDLPYRVEAWSFILAGGGLFNNLDYSFTVGHEDGTFVYPPKQPGGGNPVFRRQMKTLHEFIRGFDFVKMKPLNSALKTAVAGGARTYVLAEPDKAYAVYVAPAGEKPAPREVVVSLAVPDGKYKAEWVNPLTGKVEKRETVKSANGVVSVSSPPHQEDIALKLIKK
jgi:hypothetical protein